MRYHDVDLLGLILVQEQRISHPGAACPWNHISLDKLVDIALLSRREEEASRRVTRNTCLTKLAPTHAHVRDPLFQSGGTTPLQML